MQGRHERHAAATEPSVPRKRPRRRRTRDRVREDEVDGLGLDLLQDEADREEHHGEQSDALDPGQTQVQEQPQTLLGRERRDRQSPAEEQESEDEQGQVDPMPQVLRRCTGRWRAGPSCLEPHGADALRAPHRGKEYLLQAPLPPAIPSVRRGGPGALGEHADAVADLLELRDVVRGEEHGLARDRSQPMSSRSSLTASGPARCPARPG